MNTYLGEFEFNVASSLRLFHLSYKPCEQVMAVLWARGGFRVVLHGEHGVAVEAQAGVGAIEELDVGFGDALGQGVTIHGEAVVH